MPVYDYRVKYNDSLEKICSVLQCIEAEYPNCNSISKQQITAPAGIQNGYYEQGKMYINRNKLTFKGATR
ncbi:hypothetical protein R1S87_000735 [Escherichia coli]|uniref:hypothetical protein n=1 Tax=Escherichia coli TaxID=562 RepID=UPI001E33BCFD|nr:hypothetical protein [Escherichia coli]EEU9511433.1 zinc ribbon domain-containing protein [Escherichia coli]ELP1225061.1 hypothetical protein [Escherichia coli]MCE4015312.1 hypothetical protein [Escherichia coli]HCJ4432500.1 hypothetical protein [Escherichia coli]HCX4687887.1 hypothetical protein [Escherichia coli]